MIFSEDFTPATLQRNGASLVTEPHGFSQVRRLRRCAQLRRLACPTGRHQRHFQRPQARHCRDRLQTRAPQRCQGSMGGTNPFTFHAETSTLTTSWRRQKLFCSQQYYTQICPFTPTSPSAWGFSATCCSSCKTQTSASSTWPSLASTHECPNQYGSLVSVAANELKCARRLAFESRRGPGHRVSTHPRGHRRQFRSEVPR